MINAPLVPFFTFIIFTQKTPNSTESLCAAPRKKTCRGHNGRIKHQVKKIDCDRLNSPATHGVYFHPLQSLCSSHSRQAAWTPFLMLSQYMALTQHRMLDISGRFHSFEVATINPTFKKKTQPNKTKTTITLISCYRWIIQIFASFLFYFQVNITLNFRKEKKKKKRFSVDKEINTMTVTKCSL